MSTTEPDPPSMDQARPRLRVLNVLFDDRAGGARKRIVEVGGRLGDRGIETVLALPEGDGVAPDPAGETGVQVLRARFARPRGNRRLVYLLSVPVDVVRFFRLIRQVRPDVVHVNAAFFLAPALAARLAGFPLLWHLNDTIVPRPLAPLLGLVVRALADRIAVAAEAVARHYGVPASACAVLYAPVDTERLTPSARPSGAGPRRIGLVGNWTWVKGIEVFLEAAARVREHLDEELEIHLVGARLESQRAYADRIDGLIDELGLDEITVRHGFLDDPERVIAALDVLVLSSHSDACPQAVLEAMALAVPVAASDVGGVRELLRPGTDAPAGAVVPPDDPAALAEAILDLLRNRETAATLGRNGRALAEAHFSLALCAEHHRALYERLSSS